MLHYILFNSLQQNFEMKKTYLSFAQSVIVATMNRDDNGLFGVEKQWKVEKTIGRLMVLEIGTQR